MQKAFTYYTDPGHGWLKVPRKLLATLEITDKISSCSYEYGTNVYLEEDCDAGIFLDAFKLANDGEKPIIKSSHTNLESKIRRYYRFDIKSRPLSKNDVLDAMLSGTPVSIYGNPYAILDKRGNHWSVIDGSGAKFTAKTSQIQAYVP